MQARLGIVLGSLLSTLLAAIFLPASDARSFLTFALGVACGLAALDYVRETK